MGSRIQTWGVFKGGEGRQPVDFFYLDMAIDHSIQGGSICKLTDHEANMGWGCLDKWPLKKYMSLCTHEWGNIQISTFSSYVWSETRPCDGEPWLSDKLSDLWGNVVYSLFNRAAGGGRRAGEWAYGNTQIKGQGQEWIMQPLKSPIQSLFKQRCAQSALIVK